MSESGAGAGAGAGAAPAGWYADSAGTLRWWDGTAWTEHVAPAAAAATSTARDQPGAVSWTAPVDPLQPASSPYAAPAGYPPGAYGGAAPGGAPYAMTTGAPNSGRSHWVAWLVAGVLGVLVLVGGGVAALVAVGRNASGPTTVTHSRTNATPDSGGPSSTATPSPTATADPGPVTAPVLATQGTAVFTADFRATDSGWPTKTLPSGTSFAYDRGRYVISAKGLLHHYAFAPWDVPVQRMSAAVTLTQPAKAAVGDGGGVMCDRGTGANAVRYEFLLLAGSGWFVEESSGPLRTAVTYPVTSGRSPAMPQGRVATVTGVCQTTADNRSTRLTMFIGGVKVADVVRTTPVVGGGWLSSIDVASQTAVVNKVTVTAFEVRDLEH